MQKYQYYDGVKFTRDNKTGYYLNSTIHKRMHRYVWECYHGEIPKGFQVHHKDKNKANNDISNLELVPFSEHAKMHSTEKAKENHSRMVVNLRENALPKAAEWHRSDEGRRWHKEHYEKMKDRFRAERTLVCEICGKTYVTRKQGVSRFCSNGCRAAWRRKSGIDNVDRVCPVCGKTFTANRYSKTETCGRSCANRKRTLK